MTNNISRNSQPSTFQPLEAKKVLQEMGLPIPAEASKTHNLFSSLKDMLLGANASTTLTYTRVDNGKQQQITAAITGTRREIKELNRMMRGTHIEDVAQAVNSLVEKQLPATKAKQSKPPKAPETKQPFVNPHPNAGPNYGKTYWSRDNRPVPIPERLAQAESFEIDRGSSNLPEAPPTGALLPKEQQPHPPQRLAQTPDPQRDALIAQREAEVAKYLEEARKAQEANRTIPQTPVQVNQESTQIEKKIAELNDQIAAEKINRDDKAAKNAPQKLLARIDSKIGQLESQVAELEQKLDY